MLMVPPRNDFPWKKDKSLNNTRTHQQYVELDEIKVSWTEYQFFLHSQTPKNTNLKRAFLLFSSVHQETKQNKAFGS